MNLPSFRIGLTLLIVCLSISGLRAQGERDVWYFGQLSGMDFSNINPVSLNNNRIERQITFGVVLGPNNIICANDEEGNLLFYTDGVVFKNRLNETMMNSRSFENIAFYTQAAVVRDPGNPNRYYVFVSVEEFFTTVLTYTVIDMTLDGGLGGVVEGKKHVRLTSDIGSHLVTARHANGRDVWLIMTRNGSFSARLINQAGISGVSVPSPGLVDFGESSDQYYYGMMEISANNKLLAAAFPRAGKIGLFEFNNLSGSLSPVYQDILGQATDDTRPAAPEISLEFSLNSKLLYTAGQGGLRQYNLTDINAIPLPFIVSSTNPNYLKRSSNGRIYGIQLGSNFVSEIRNPDVIGAGCNYNFSVLQLSGSNLFDLPTFLLPKYSEGISFINICQGSTTEMNLSGSFIRGLSTIEWDLGDGNVATGQNIDHTYQSPGIYTVTANVIQDNEVIESFTEEITIFKKPEITEPEDLYLCSENTNAGLFGLNDELLGNIDSFEYNISYYLSFDDAELKTNEIYDIIPQIGTNTVWIRVENKESPTCYEIVTLNIITPEFISIDIPTEQFICDTKEGITLVAPDGFLTYSWSSGDNTQSTTVFDDGDYTLTVVKDFGSFTCEAETTITVLPGDPNPPVIADIIVNDWSQNHNSIEVIVDENRDLEYSVDGFNYQSSPIFENLPINDYRVYVRDANCFAETVSDELFLLYYNHFFTPNNDGANDYWQVINSKREVNLEIMIFDRYGKFLAKIDPLSRGWDGTLNGNELPVSDYWFRLIRQNGDVHTGHFSLKR